MKLKSRPEDFRVEEIARPEIGNGPFALYRLTKKSIGTPEAIDAICRAWKVPRPAVGIGGLKDRHAATSQYLSIERGPKRNLHQTNIDLQYLGQTPRAFESHDIVANHFEIVLRDLEPAEADCIVRDLPQAAADGAPNYFDDQRFGSLGESGDFIARPWCLGDYERALWLALADGNEHDRPQTREIKEFLRTHWGDWAACRSATNRPLVRAVAEHLSHRPHDFRGAFVRIPQHERRMYLAAFQSFLWNRVLAELIRTRGKGTELFEVEIGRAPLPFYRGSPSAELREQLQQPLPLPSARDRHELGPLTELYERVAGEFGLECRTLRVKYPRDSFFSRGSRDAVLRPESLSWETGNDEQAPGRQKLLLRFDLPSGSYATLFVKRITAAS
jgi:tRNA pseudouridine13 synthase